jgi:tetratricopeptide (TPR) repeat protein
MENYEALKQSADAHYIAKEYGAAIKDYTELIDSGLKDTGVYYNRGVAYYETKEYIRAVADLEQAVALNPGAKSFKKMLKAAQFAAKPSGFFMTLFGTRLARALEFIGGALIIIGLLAVISGIGGAALGGDVSSLISGIVVGGLAFLLFWKVYEFRSIYLGKYKAK